MNTLRVGDRVRVIKWPDDRYVGRIGTVLATEMPVAKADEIGWEIMPIICVRLDRDPALLGQHELTTGDTTCFSIRRDP